MRKVVGVYFVFASFISLPSTVSAEGEKRFSYGSDCSLLAQLTHAELVATVHPLNAEYFERFCIARGVYSCTSYTSLLDGLGELEDNGVLGCRFITSSSSSTP
jgi:hypothetical protein